MDEHILNKFLDNTVSSDKQNINYVLECMKSYREAKQIIDNTHSSAHNKDMFDLPVSTNSIITIKTNGKI
jgi:hypothetical protein